MSCTLPTVFLADRSPPPSRAGGLIRQHIAALIARNDHVSLIGGLGYGLAVSTPLTLLAVAVLHWAGVR